MKKSILFGTLVASSILLSGCGTKTLSCSKIETADGYSANETVEAKFVGNEVTNFKLSMTMTLDDEFKDNMDLFKSMLEEQFSSYKNKDGLKFEINSKNDIEIDLVLDADLKKMSDDDKKELDFIDTKGSYEATKKEFEDDGYTCK